MSWVSDYNYCWYEKLAINLIRAGGIPNHVAFVMDGNRRYAKSVHLPQIAGHSHGFSKLAECLRWCLDLGIRKVTVFAFSIENFKRSNDEVNDLLNLAREKFEKLLSEKEKLREHGVRINVIGNLKLLPTDCQELIARAMLETEHNDQLYLNIAFSYSSRDEMTQAVETVLKHGQNLLETDLNEQLFQQLLYIPADGGPDLLIRTSGETRISDFLMWQLSKTVLYFTPNLWPQVTIWNLLSAIISYQRAQRCRDVQSVETQLDLINNNKRVLNFLTDIKVYRKNMLLQMSTAE